MEEKAGSSNSSDNGDSRNSSQSSGCEEEQLRRLFNSCDADGDGYLDSEDLRFMCRMLNMSDSVQEVRDQLGLSDTSKISFHDFMHCRSQVMLQSGFSTNPGSGSNIASQTPYGVDPNLAALGSEGYHNAQSMIPHRRIQQHHYPNNSPIKQFGHVDSSPQTLLNSNCESSARVSNEGIRPYRYPGTAPPRPNIALPSSVYPYPHEPSSSSSSPHHNCHHQQHQLYQHHHPEMGIPHYDYIIPKADNTGLEYDGPEGVSKLTSWPTLSSDSLGALSGTKSTDYDSGARDLSPEPLPHSTLTLTQLVESHDPVTFAKLRESGTDSLLHIADRLHAAAVTSMKGELVELQNQVRQLTLQQQPLTTLSPGSGKQQPHVLDTRFGAADFEDRLEELTSRYEERIIELHSVIAELRKKVERHQISVIKEEDEGEESDQAQSVHSNGDESLREENLDISQEFSRVVSEFKPTLDRVSSQSDDVGDELSKSFTARIKAENGEENPHLDDLTKEDSAGTELDEEKLPELPPRAARLPGAHSIITHDPSVRLEVATLRAHNDELRRQTSEVTSLKSHNDDLKRRGQALEAELAQLSNFLEEESKEKQRLKRQVNDLQQKLQQLEESDAMVTPTQTRVVTSPYKSPSKTATTFRGSSNDVKGTTEGEAYPVAKVAELKKLKTCASATEVTVLGVQNLSKAETIVQSGVAERLKSSAVSVDHSTASGDSGVVDHQQMSELSAAVVAEFEVELERRQAKCDHLKAQNDVLSATLEESRTMAERLSVQLGKYESNSTALQLAAAYGDHCLESQDVLAALLDSEMGVLLANCRAAGLGALAGNSDFSEEDQVEVTAVLRRAHHARRKAESVATHLLARLDRGGGGVGGCSQASGGKPWEDVSTNSRTASTTSSTGSSTENHAAEFTKLEETRLREHIHQLKAERSAVRTTVLEIESVHMDPIISEPRKRVEAQRLDLENAVLVQELMAVKEEKAELKAGSYLLEKEKKALELRLSGHEAQEWALRLQVEHLQGEIKYFQQDDTLITNPKQSPSSSPHKLKQSSSPSLGIMGKKSRHSSSSGGGGRGSPSSTLSSSSSSSDIAVTKSSADLTKELSVAKAREATLKSRVTELLAALEKLSKNSELRHRQSSEFVGDLKRANAALISAFDRAKRKYQTRLKRMEGQLRVLREAGVVMESGKGKGGARAGGGEVLPPPNETDL